MDHSLIARPTNIYEFPTEFEARMDVVTVGDLHGNAAKLAHMLFRHQIISFQDGVNPVTNYADFIRIYERNGVLCKSYLSNKHALVKLERRIASYHAPVSFETSSVEAMAVPEAARLEKERKLNEALWERAHLNATQTELKEELAKGIVQFRLFMQQIKINDPTTLIQLIGDEVGDRGSNDYFTIVLLDFLKRNDVSVTKLISNHGHEFVSAYERMLTGFEFEPAGTLFPSQSVSISGLKLLLDLNIIDKEELTSLVESYKSSLKIIDYLLHDDGITLISHAPIRFDVLKKIARHMGVVYDDSTKEALATTIDKVNTKFAVAVAENRVHKLYELGDFDAENMSATAVAQNPLEYVMWNRWNAAKDNSPKARPASVNGYAVHYVHGHDPYPSRRPHISNLDTLNGKMPRAEIAEKKRDFEAPSVEGGDEHARLWKKRMAAPYQPFWNEPDKTTVEKTLATRDGRKLDQQHDPLLIDLEYRQAQSATRYNRRTIGVLTALGLALGGLVGVGLLGTGVFAIIGAVVLGGVIGATLGLGYTQLAKPPVISTRVDAADTANATLKDLLQRLAVGFHPAAHLVKAPVISTGEGAVDAENITLEELTERLAAGFHPAAHLAAAPAHHPSPLDSSQRAVEPGVVAAVSPAISVA
jgi:hypothetical protein